MTGHLSVVLLAATVLAASFSAALAQKTKDIAIGNIVGGDWPLTGKFLAPTPTPTPGAAAGPNQNECPKTIEHVEFTKLAEVKETQIYSVDFDRINVDGEKCSDSNPAKDRLIVMPSEPSISKLTQIPEIQNLDLSTIFSGSGLEIGNEVQSSLNDLLDTQTFMVGVDLGDRSCGDVETPANTPYLFVTPQEDITISARNNLVLKGGKDNMISMNKEALCMYSRERPTKAAEAVDGTLDKVKNAAECFPAHATVALQSGETKRMDEVEAGDVVLVGVNQYSEVFGFTHKSADAVSEFIRLETCCGEVLYATRGHFLHVNGGLKAAGAVRIGDAVMSAGGATKHVVSVRAEQARGLYNPQTLHGDIVVDGLLASTYTTAVEPGLAHAALTPARVLYQAFGVAATLESGGGGLADALPGAAAVY